MTDHLEDSLTALLDERAGAAPATVSLAEVGRRSAGLRRRRRSLVAAGAAAVVAGVLVVPSLVAGDDAAGPPAQSPTSPAPTATDGPTEPTSPARPIRTVRVVETGPLTEIPLDDDPAAYVLGNEVVEPDGTRTPLPPTHTAGYLAATPYRGGWLVTRSLEREDGAVGADAIVVVVGPDGEVVQQVPGSGVLAVADGRVAWWEADGGEGVLHVDRMDADAPGRDFFNGTSFGGGRRLDPVGFLGFHDIVLRDRATAVVMSMIFDTLGHIDGITVSGVGADGLVSGSRATSPPGEHGAVVDDRGRQLVWASDRWRLGAFSPDGSVVTGTSSATGGEVDAVAALDARTGAESAVCALLTAELQIGLGASRANDDGTVDLVGTEGYGRTGTTAVLRCHRDGTLTRLSPVVAADPGAEEAPLALVQP